MRSVFSPLRSPSFRRFPSADTIRRGQANDSPAAQDIASAAVAQQLKMRRIINMDQKRGIATVVDRH